MSNSNTGDLDSAARKQVKNPAPTDEAERYLHEYLSGMRCYVCDGLRTGNAKQCPHQREAILRDSIEAVEEWASQIADPKLARLVQTASSAAISRATLRAGLRNAPSTIDGLSVGGLIGLVHRSSKGRVMEWSRNTLSGDEMPV